MILDHGLKQKTDKRLFLLLLTSGEWDVGFLLRKRVDVSFAFWAEPRGRMPVGGRRDVETLMPEGMKSKVSLPHLRGP